MHDDLMYNIPIENKFKRTLNLILWNSQLIFHIIWRSPFIFSHENHWAAWSLWIEMFPNEIQLFSNTLSFNLNGRIHVIFSLGFCVEKNLNSWRSESKYESLGKSSYSLSFNFQKVSNSLTFRQSIKQSVKSIYLL